MERGMLQHGGVERALGSLQGMDLFPVRQRVNG